MVPIRIPRNLNNMYIYTASVLLALVHSTLTSFGNKESYTPRQFVTSGLIRMYGDFGAIILLSIEIFK